ncbi:hypothetical protein B296_00007101 [Ensete ventricosum]|uniref:Uncharacterized protein n=1 Tax=Ensete ventricosum TaxID=4639 RepID=A0A427AR01_ENSVE|nr:hypothetical protein B296_00007101 [Ensete ventricosum]
MAEALRYVDIGHIWRSHSLSSLHENLYAIEMSQGGDMVQRIMVEQFVVMQHMRTYPVRDMIMQKYDQELLGALLWRVFRVCASKLALDESLSHQHIGAVYYRGRSQIVSTKESHGGDLIIQRHDQSGWRVGLLQYSYSFKGARQVRGQDRNYLEDIVVLKQVVERGDEATTRPEGLNYPKAIALARKEVDLEEHHSAAEADLPIVKEGTQMQGNG